MVVKNGTLPRTGDLEAFVAITEEGGVNGAARRMRVPKSTISRRLSRLEDELGIRLFRRNRLKLELTDPGRRLLHLCQDALDSVTSVTLAAAEIRSLPRGTIRLSAPSDLATHHDLWLGFAKRHPEIELQLTLSNRYVDVVREGYDAALRGGRGDDETLIARKLGEYPLTAVASPAYRDAHGVLEHPGELREHSALLLNTFKRNPQATPKPPHRHLYINDLHLVKEGALRGMGIAVLPTHLVQDELASGHLVAILPAYDPLQVPLFAVYPERPFLRPAVTALLDYMSKAFAGDGGCTSDTTR